MTCLEDVYEHTVGFHYLPPPDGRSTLGFAECTGFALILPLSQGPVWIEWFTRLAWVPGHFMQSKRCFLTPLFLLLTWLRSLIISPEDGATGLDTHIMTERAVVTSWRGQCSLYSLPPSPSFLSSRGEVPLPGGAIRGPSVGLAHHPCPFKAQGHMFRTTFG